MADLKHCPHCSEEILATAKVCKHCGREIKRRTSIPAVGCLILVSVIFVSGIVALLPEPLRQPADPITDAVATQWQISLNKSPIDDSQTVALQVKADQSIAGWPARTTTPTLVVRCQQNKTEMFINTGFAPNVGTGNLDGATVTLRFGSEQARNYQTKKSTDGEALFFSEAIGLINEMMDHDSLFFQFIPFNSDPQNTTFNISKLEARIEPLRTACNW